MENARDNNTMNKKGKKVRVRAGKVKAIINIETPAARKKKRVRQQVRKDSNASTVNNRP